MKEGNWLSPNSCLCLECFNWALDSEIVRQGKKLHLQLPHPSHIYETAGGDQNVIFGGKTLTILLEETATTTTVYMEAHDVCSTTHYIYAQNMYWVQH